MLAPKSKQNSSEFQSDFEKAICANSSISSTGSSLALHQPRLQLSALSLKGATPNAHNPPNKNHIRC
jgi:hypothetical protein